MTTSDEQLARLRAFNAEVRERDVALNEETKEKRRQREGHSDGTPKSPLAEETIVLRRNRPVLAVKGSRAVSSFRDEEESTIWKDRLEKASEITHQAILSVGRIELANADDWLGTGWLADDDILVTNRHVAEKFATRSGDDFVFTLGPRGRAAVDFLQEIESTDTRIFRLLQPLYIEPRGGPDLAFFRIEHASGNGKLAPRIPLGSPSKTIEAAVIGYPAWDPRVPDAQLMSDTFGDVYNKKRLAPGAVTEVGDQEILHDCSTLGGNSGSVLLDLNSGAALGLHFSGTFLKTNYALRADLVKQRLDEARSTRRRSRVAISRDDRIEVRHEGGEIHFSAPLRITLSLGDATPTRSPDRAVGRLVRPPRTPDVDESFEEERVTAADYRDRRGYLEEFLHENGDRKKKIKIAHPTITKKKTDVLTFDPGDGSKETILRYQNFSVVMSDSRRMCRYSACNIDGGLSKKTLRPGWRLDPRIPKDKQIRGECYGNSPKFSRGHMTRREDPAWGDTKAEANLGCADSMHVTNATPQMQAFNSPIWLELEDYALQNAREDDMRICVFTGPYLLPSDPKIFGVKIPRRFWKIIAFVHDETGELCATGYEMGQEDNLPTGTEDEFVFGEFISTHTNLAAQVSIASIQSKAGLEFADLADHDPFRDEEDAGAEATPLLSLDQIRFR